jgi:hypothetical protein
VEAITRQEICGDVAGWKDFESTVVSCRLWSVVKVLFFPSVSFTASLNVIRR